MFTLRCTSVADAQGGKVQVQFKALTPVPPVPEESADSPARRAVPVPYPGFAVVGNLTTLLAPADAAGFERGNNYSLAEVTAATK